VISTGIWKFIPDFPPTTSLLLLLFDKEVQRKKRRIYNSSRGERDTSAKEESGTTAEI